MNFLTVNYLNTRIAKIVLAAMLFFLQFSADVFAQTEDPLKKPEIWKKLTVAPTDSSLWVKYYGKTWSAMTIKDMEKISTWKQELMLRQLADQEAVVGFVIPADQPDFFIDDAAFNEMISVINQARSAKPKGAGGTKKHVTRAEIAGMEAIILEDRSELTELRSNVHANFTLIEEIYKEIFKEFNIDYVSYKDYHSKNPQIKYTEVRWVEEQEKKLKDIKVKQVQELRKTYAVGN